ncbi:MAG: KH domain-containing protein [Clostridia bacterium]|jgi:predicted RNA-binding protein YlqC (UPF0109 family)|nr:KH domain-containing protein [Clostridia bacterium]
MSDLKQTLVDIAKVLVDHPEEVAVVETEDDEGVLLILTVAEGDMGKVIGRHGKIAKAIRTVMKSAANKDGRRVTVEIEDND